MNSDELEWALMKAERRVLEIQTKLHRWATDDSHRRFDDLFNLVADPAFLLVAWDRVRGNKGARTAGVDGKTARSIEAGQGVEMFLGRLRDQIRDCSFRPVPVRERMIPKANGKLRRLGIPTVADRVVQASLNECWSRCSKRSSSRVPMGSARTAGLMTRSPRLDISPATDMSGWWRATSRRASTRSRIRLSWNGCGIESGTSGCCPW